MSEPSVAKARVLGIAKRLIGFDTTVDEPASAARDELACQEYAAGLLADVGFEVDLWEPSTEQLRRHPNYIEGQHWRKRPNLVARLPGSGSGKSLLLNGHIDTVPAGDPALWTTGPWRAEVRSGRLYGRGACDMKGGVASMLAGALAVAASDTNLSGDLLVGLVTDEEVNGLGTIALLDRGYRADAAVVPEPNELQIHVAFRGILLGELEITGRSGHVEIPQPHWSEGGGVNAISKMRFLLDELDRLSQEWRNRGDKQHPLCAPGAVHVTQIQGGDFAANIPAVCSAMIDICYVPGEEDDRGGGSHVRQEVEAFVRRAGAADPWLDQHPPRLRWTVDFPPAEIEDDHELPVAIAALLEGHQITPHRCGLDTWDDTASLIHAGIPAVSFGPGSNDQAHAVDEYVDVRQLERHTQLLTELIMNWCGRTDV